MSAPLRSALFASLVGGMVLYAAQLPARQDAPPPPPIPEHDTQPAVTPAPASKAERETAPSTPAPTARRLGDGNEPLPPKIVDEELEPAVTIRKEGDITYEEYRAEGRIYMIKVTPAGGVPFYLLDTDGDGNLETHSDDQRGQPVKPVYWKLKEW